MVIMDKHSAPRTPPGVSLEPGRAVWMRRPQVGWVKAHLVDRIGGSDLWRVSTGPGDNYLRHERDLRPNTARE
jgi:hypothetical protein